MERWTPTNPDEEPFANLNLPNGETLSAKRDNTHLHKHLGSLEMFDFIRVEQGDDRDNVLIFNFVGGYKELEQYMLENGYPMHLNQVEVEDSVEKAFYRAHGSVDDFVPDEWQ